MPKLNHAESMSPRATDLPSAGVMLALQFEGPPLYGLQAVVDALRRLLAWEDTSLGTV